LIFDAHVYPISVPGGLQLATPDGIRQLMADEHIDRVLLVAKDADLLLRHIEEIDGAYAMLWTDPRSPGVVDQARSVLEHPKFRGLKLDPALDAFDPDDATVHPLLTLAAEHGVPVSVHCGHPPPSLYALPWMIERAVVRFPQVRFVLAHMGYCVFEYHEGAMVVAERRANVYLEIGGMPHNWRIKEAVGRVGPDRVLHGSAAPWHHPRLALRKARMSDLAPTDLAAVLGESAAAIYLRGDSAG